MGRRSLYGAAVVAFLGLTIALPVAAHNGNEEPSIAVEPPTVTAGGTVVLAGDALEPNSDREIELVGPDMIVSFAKVTTDAEGMFNVTLTIPGHLPTGTYRFEAIGDETVTADLAVHAAAGQAMSEPPNEAAAVVQPRARSGLELGVIAFLIVAAAGFGLALIFGAERFGRRPAREAAAD